MIVDTSVLSRALRRRVQTLSTQEGKIVEEFKRLLSLNQVTIPGPVFQEILTGIKSDRDFRALSAGIHSAEIIIPEEDDFLHAAQIANQCLDAGITTGANDALIVSIAVRRDLPIFTTDRDFSRIADIVPLRLNQPLHPS